MKTIQTKNSIPRTSLCLHSEFLLVWFVFPFHFSSQQITPGIHASYDLHIFVSLPLQSLVLLLGDEIGHLPSPVAFFFSFLLSSWLYISSHHSSAMFSYLQ